MEMKCRILSQFFYSPLDVTSVPFRSRVSYVHYKLIKNNIPIIYCFRRHRNRATISGADHQPGWCSVLLPPRPHHTRDRGDRVPLGRPGQIQLDPVQEHPHHLLWNVQLSLRLHRHHLRHYRNDSQQNGIIQWYFKESSTYLGRYL